MSKIVGDSNYTLTVGEMQSRLVKYDPDQPIQFYVLVDHDLISCDIETILDMDHTLEITVEPRGA